MPGFNDSVVADPGAGGAVFATEQYTIATVVTQFPATLVGVYVDDTTPPNHVSSANPYPVQLPIQLAHTDYVTSSALAAGTSTDLDATVIPVAKTGKLLKVIVGSSVACRWDVKTRDGAVEVVKGSIYTSGISVGRPTEIWETPQINFLTLAGAGVDENFRVAVTNLDANQAADVSVTFFWDEV